MRKPAMTQYNVEFPNEPTVHAKLIRFITKEKIPYKSMITIRVGDRSIIQFLAPKNNGLRGKLEKIGIKVREEQIFQLEMPHHPWELHKLAQSLAKKGINILSLYSKVKGNNMRIVLAVDQTANALELIHKLGFNSYHNVYE